MEGKNVDCIYLDFPKAHNLVDMSILLVKVKKMGIGGRIIRWIYKFLRNRTQKIRVSKCLSEEREITSRVPLLFLIYIEELGLKSLEPSKNPISMVIKFVDDSKVIRNIEDKDEIIALLDDLDTIYK